MGVGKWLKRQAAAIAFSMASVEKNVFSQNGNNLEKNINQEQRHNQGTLADSLLNGVITAEVEALRWRTYKVLNAMDKMSTKTVVDSNGKLKVKQDSFDSYDLEMVINNAPVTVSQFEALDDASITLTDNDEISWTSVDKNERPIKIYREDLPKFQIEDYTDKLHIRRINENERLLEFYISKYPDEYNRNTRLLISEIKKAIINPRGSNMLNIIEVGFITNDAIGVKNHLEFQYAITSFDKIVEFGGHYIIKFKAHVLVNGDDLLEKYRNESLDAKYENKERRKVK